MLFSVDFNPLNFPHEKCLQVKHSQIEILKGHLPMKLIEPYTRELRVLVCSYRLLVLSGGGGGDKPKLRDVAKTIISFVTTLAHNMIPFYTSTYVSRFFVNNTFNSFTLMCFLIATFGFE